MCSSPRCVIRESRQRFCRGFRAIYLGLLMNCLILGWVTKAMTSIVAVTLDVSDRNALAICVLFLIPFTGLYVALGGLWGVLWTTVSVRLKYGDCDWSRVVRSCSCRRMHSLLSRLAEMRTAAGPGAGDATAFFPDFSRPFSQEGLWLLPVITFVVNIGLQWWAFWYPGASRRRRVHCAAHLQRQGRKERIAGCALVQRRTLCVASLALDSDCSGRGCFISAPRTS